MCSSDLGSSSGARNAWLAQRDLYREIGSEGPFFGTSLWKLRQVLTHGQTVAFDFVGHNLILHWGIATSQCSTWAPPKQLPPGSEAFAGWAGGNAVRTPLAPVPSSQGKLEAMIELPAVVGGNLGIAFVLFDADRNAYITDDAYGGAFFIDAAAAEQSLEKEMVLRKEQEAQAKAAAAAAAKLAAEEAAAEKKAAEEALLAAEAKLAAEEAAAAKYAVEEVFLAAKAQEEAEAQEARMAAKAQAAEIGRAHV